MMVFLQKDEHLTPNRHNYVESRYSFTNILLRIAIIGINGWNRKRGHQWKWKIANIPSCVQEERS